MSPADLPPYEHSLLFADYIAKVSLGRIKCVRGMIANISKANEKRVILTMTQEHAQEPPMCSSTCIDSSSDDVTLTS